MFVFRCRDEAVVLPNVAGADVLLAIGGVKWTSQRGGAMEARQLERRCIDSLMYVDDRRLMFMIESLRGFCAEFIQHGDEAPVVTFCRVEDIDIIPLDCDS